MRIGFLGMQCGSGNLGVDALAYSAVKLMDAVVPGRGEFYFFSPMTAVALGSMATSLELHDKTLVPAPIRHKSPPSMVRTLRLMRDCDAVLDLTGGDSFSDIYGVKRLLAKLFDKEMVLAAGTPLVLGPQTYGPFQHRAPQLWVKRVLRRSALVVARDTLSQACAGKLLGRPPMLATDVALDLPWSADRYDLPPTDSIRVGVNASGLLWRGGHTGGNQFGLRADYPRFCRTLLDRLLAEGRYEIHLIPHVIARDPGAADDDLAVCQDLAAAYPACHLAPTFTNPVDAKSYISTMDIMIGSRMHATIAAFSVGIPTIPVAYSRKFQGMFGSLGYPAVVDLASMDAVEAVDQVMGLVRDAGRLRELAAAGRTLGAQRLEALRRQVGALLAGEPPAQSGVTR